MELQNQMRSKYIATLFFFLVSIVSYAQLDTALYGLTRNDLNLDIQLSKMDPQTGEVTHISSSLGYNYDNWAITAIDSNNEIFYCVSQDSLLGVDMNSGDRKSVV